MWCHWIRTNQRKLVLDAEVLIPIHEKAMFFAVGFIKGDKRPPVEERWGAATAIEPPITLASLDHWQR